MRHLEDVFLIFRFQKKKLSSHINSQEKVHNKIYFEISFLVFPSLSALKKININRSGFDGLKEVNTPDFLYLHSLRSMELVEKTELFKRPFYALSKVNLGRYGSFRKILLILSWDINLNPGLVQGSQHETLLHVLPLDDCSFARDDFDYDLNNFSENVSRNDWDLFKKIKMRFTHKNVNSILPKVDEVSYIVNVTNVSIIGISQTKLDQTNLLCELEVDGYYLIRLDVLWWWCCLLH